MTFTKFLLVCLLFDICVKIILMAYFKKKNLQLISIKNKNTFELNTYFQMFISVAK